MPIETLKKLIGNRRMQGAVGGGLCAFALLLILTGYEITSVNVIGFQFDRVNEIIKKQNEEIEDQKSLIERQKIAKELDRDKIANLKAEVKSLKELLRRFSEI